MRVTLKVEFPRSIYHFDIENVLNPFVQHLSLSIHFEWLSSDGIPIKYNLKDHRSKSKLITDLSVFKQ